MIIEVVKTFQFSFLNGNSSPKKAVPFNFSRILEFLSLKDFSKNKKNLLTAHRDISCGNQNFRITVANFCHEKRSCEIVINMARLSFALRK